MYGVSQSVLAFLSALLTVRVRNKERLTVFFPKGCFIKSHEFTRRISISRVCFLMLGAVSVAAFGAVRAVRV